LIREWIYTIFGANVNLTENISRTSHKALSIISFINLKFLKIN
jgi:hypothetical protein